MLGGFRGRKWVTVTPTRPNKCDRGELDNWQGNCCDPISSCQEYSSSHLVTSSCIIRFYPNALKGCSTDSPSFYVTKESTLNSSLCSTVILAGTQPKPIFTLFIRLYGLCLFNPNRLRLFSFHNSTIHTLTSETNPLILYRRTVALQKQGRSERAILPFHI